MTLPAKCPVNAAGDGSIAGRAGVGVELPVLMNSCFFGPDEIIRRIGQRHLQERRAQPDAGSGGDRPDRGKAPRPLPVASPA